MDILDFKMPPFSRMQWASSAIKQKYEPMLEKSKNVFRVLEKETVVHGLRDVTTESIGPDNMGTRIQELSNKGLIFLPIRKVGEYNGMSSYHPPVIKGRPWNYYGVVARDVKKAMEFSEASESGDHKTLGRLLGYPECCVNFFDEQFASKGITDTIWQQAENTEGTKVMTNGAIRVSNTSWESNTMYRSIGVGPLFHMPCSFDCEHSERIAKEWIKLGKELKVDGMLEMEMFLRMPVEWDALKGIAYLRTPVFKLSVNTVMCTTRHKVQLDGTYYPLDSPKSIQFPWSESIPTLKRNENKLDMEEVINIEAT